MSRRTRKPHGPRPQPVEGGFISCRSVGPGGTTVSFYATPAGVEAVWVNENCPYSGPGEKDERDAAHDGHNVSLLPWEVVLRMARLAPGDGAGPAPARPGSMLSKLTKKDLPVGTPVQSRFRAAWSGTVVESHHHDPPHTVQVRRTHDRHGRPMRKPSTVRLDPAWLQIIPALPVWPWWK